MITVVISFPNDQRQNVLLAGIPRVGDSIRLANGPSASPSYDVKQVLWMESKAGVEPTVIIFVNPRPDGQAV